MIGIISDIHGNHVALVAVLGELKKIGVDEVICLGDIGGYYCQINECCDTLRQEEIFTLMGNHDWYLATGEGCPRSNSANRCLDYQRQIISEANLAWLQSLKPRAVVGELDIVHGGWIDPIDEYVTPSAEYFAEIPGQFFCSGHTHVPCVLEWSGKTYCNPGSVGQPRDGDPRASFSVWNGSGFSLHRVEYDFRRVQYAMRDAGFEPYFYENLAAGARIGGKIDKLSIQG